eukprot:Blabericola_migrator_1__5591@NODE_2847_length_2293_cov_86_862983_g1074_i3_p2_GENE_NODE_2847_length_2293_cov_86_862983_g1074_i3NODE_2847_length_2293_cov_86_862983_g1074_i3_p2_ORF_typecomplete_len212_score33_38SLC35F/PF06027_12/0_26_NODE_2847_length_2293_cov_86_862983_g1074_i3115750
MSSVLAVGIEGAAGAGICGVILPLIHLSGVENLHQGFYQLSISVALRTGLWWYAILSLMNNVTGVVVTKWSSGLLRCLFMSLRPPLIWAAEMCLGWNRFDFYNLTAMILLGVGIAVHLLAPPLDQKGPLREVLTREVPCACLQDDTRALLQSTESLDDFQQSELVKFGASPITVATMSSPTQASLYITDLSDDSLLKDEETSKLSGNSGSE